MSILESRLDQDYYTPKTPSGPRNSPAEKAHLAEYHRLIEEFKGDLEAELCDARFPHVIREKLYHHAVELAGGNVPWVVMAKYEQLHNEVYRPAFEAGIDWQKNV